MLIPVPASRNGAPWGSPNCRPRERRRTSLARLDELVLNASAPRLLQYAWPQLMLPLGAALTIEGPPGSGKSTVASAAAVGLAHQHHIDVLYLSTEEGAEDSALARFRRVAGMLGVPIAPRIVISDVADVHEADRDLLAFEGDLGGRRGLVVAGCQDPRRSGEQGVAHGEPETEARCSPGLSAGTALGW
jgi:ABC-type uncharacterized transport system YnjBCD ATPase subunit